MGGSPGTLLEAFWLPMTTGFAASSDVEGLLRGEVQDDGSEAHSAGGTEGVRTAQEEQTEKGREGGGGEGRS